MGGKVRESRRYVWAGIAVFAGWCLAGAAGLPLLLGMAPGRPPRGWILVALLALGVTLVLSGELSRRSWLSRG